MNRRLLVNVLLIITLASAAFFSARQAGAIPGFARKYGFSCTTCHAPFPRLKPFGEEFAGRGFRMDDPSKEPARATLDTGDPLLRLTREFPLAVRIDGFASYKDTTTQDKTDFEWPWVLKFLSGGPISEKLSYYFYFLVEKGDVVGLEDTYLQYSGLFGLPVDLIAGQFQICDPLFKRELRLMRADYDILTVRPGLSVANLSYDRGLILNWHAPADVEVVFQATNGNGIDPAEDEEEFDSDENKNFSLRLARPFGPVRVGVFAYQGKEKVPGGQENKTTYWGPDLVFELGPKVQLSMEYLQRRDDDPFFEDWNGPKFITRGGFAELHYFPQGQDGRWVLSALFNKVQSDDEGASRESGALTLNYLMARNARLMVEAFRDNHEDANRFSVGFAAAF